MTYPAKRLRSLIESYDNVLLRYRSVLDYVSPEFLDRVIARDIDIESEVKPLIRAAEYWIRKGFEGSGYMQNCLDDFYLSMDKGNEIGAKDDLSAIAQIIRNMAFVDW